MNGVIAAVLVVMVFVAAIEGHRPGVVGRVVLTFATVKANVDLPTLIKEEITRILP